MLEPGGEETNLQGLPRRGEHGEILRVKGEWGWGCGKPWERVLEFGKKVGPTVSSWRIFICSFRRPSLIALSGFSTMPACQPRPSKRSQSSRLPPLCQQQIRAGSVELIEKGRCEKQRGPILVPSGDVSGSGQVEESWEKLTLLPSRTAGFGGILGLGSLGLGSANCWVTGHRTFSLGFPYELSELAVPIKKNLIQL